jgi:hypothetical protein
MCDNDGPIAPDGCADTAKNESVGDRNPHPGARYGPTRDFASVERLMSRTEDKRKQSRD